MLDPRIYRMGLMAVLLAVIVLAFSLADQPGPLGTTLAPQAYNAGDAYATLNNLARAYPHRAAGSAGDSQLAGYVAAQLRGDQFSVSTDTYTGRTVAGTRRLENVVAVRAGQQNGTIVLVAHRDALGSPAKAELSGTAVMLELARALSGETLQHTVVLASTTASAGGAGAIRLAENLPQPVDAVITLGDLAGSGVREPVVVPWSNGQQVAPPALRNTLAAALGAQAALPAGSTGLLGQLAHLAIPMAATEQAPFNSQGQPAVLLSLSGERPPLANEPVVPAEINAMGRTVLQAVSALDAGPGVGGPSSYLSFSGKSVPAWAIRLLVLALILPVLMATVDGIARARRRGSPILRWVGWVLAAALPFVLAGAFIVVARAFGWIAAAPPNPLGATAIHLRGAELAVMGVCACIVLVGLVWLRPALVRGLRLRTRAGEEPDGAGPAAGVLFLLCLVALAVWLANPFAALLLFPALHLWMWIVVPDVRLPWPAVVVLLLGGLALPVLVAVEYGMTLGLNPLQALWSWTLLVAGGGIGFMAVLELSIFLGCAIGVIGIALQAARQDRPEQAPVTVRGPVTYAGPGSLGGTESALRR